MRFGPKGYHGEYEARAGGHANCAPAVSAALSGRQPGVALAAAHTRGLGGAVRAPASQGPELPQKSTRRPCFTLIYCAPNLQLC